MALTNKEILLKAYAAYNHQNSEALLALVSENVDWPNGSARLRGKDALRSYWTQQWTEIRTHDEPVQITELAPNKSLVRIRQVVRALDSSPVSEGWFEHTHQIEDDVIVRMDIQNVATVTPAGDSGLVLHSLKLAASLEDVNVKRYRISSTALRWLQRAEH